MEEADQIMTQAAIARSHFDDAGDKQVYGGIVGEDEEMQLD